METAGEYIPKPTDCSAVVGKQEKPASADGRKCTGIEKLIHFQNWFAATFQIGCTDIWAEVMVEAVELR